MSKVSKTIPIINPISIMYGKKKILIMEQLKGTVIALNNGGARINLSSKYKGHEAIILITNKKVKS